jgi:hypothetical protein
MRTILPIYRFIENHWLKQLLFLSLIVFLSIPANSENIILNGTTFRVAAGTSVISMETLDIKSGGVLNNAGTLVLKRNLVNENGSQNSLGSGTVELSGTTAQIISGNNTIQNLIVNNAAGITNSGQTLINGVLTLTSGRFTLGSYNLTLGSSASISGAPSATAMIVATGSGQMRKSFSAAGTFIFPVGDNTGVAEYTPVTLVFSSGSFAAGNYAGVNLVNSAYPGSSGSYLNRYWSIVQNGISSFSCNATFQYLLADVVGSESAIYCIRVSPLPEINYQVANVALHRLTANGLTSFGTYTGRLPSIDKILNLTVFLEGLYNGPGIMRKAQNEFGDQFGGNTADQIDIELHNSANYSNIVFTANDINLSTTGVAAAIIPAANSGSYYITVRHRNSIETTSALPVSFAGSTINYAMTNPLAVYGGNLLMMVGGAYVIYGGDVNQDGYIDTGDMTPVDNDGAAFATGYLPTDCNGDGFVDTGDMTIVDNNGAAFVTTITP